MGYPLNDTNYNWERRKKCCRGEEEGGEGSSVPTLTFTDEALQWVDTGLGEKIASVLFQEYPATDENEYAWRLSQEEPISGILVGKYSTIRVYLPDETPCDYYLIRMGEVSDKIEYYFQRSKVESSNSLGVQSILLHQLPGGSAGKDWVIEFEKTV